MLFYPRHGWFLARLTATHARVIAAAITASFETAGIDHHDRTCTAPRAPRTAPSVPCLTRGGTEERPAPPPLPRLSAEHNAATRRRRPHRSAGRWDERSPAASVNPNMSRSSPIAPPPAPPPPAARARGRGGALRPYLAPSPTVIASRARNLPMRSGVQNLTQD